MDDWGDDSEDGFFASNNVEIEYDQLGRRETKALRSKLLEQLEKLYTPVELKEPTVDEDLHSGADDGPRYFSVGYAAHADSADDKELKHWQSTFPYLSVRGRGMQLPKPLSASERSNEKKIFTDFPISIDPSPSSGETKFLDPLSAASDPCVDLCVVGQSIYAQRQAQSVPAASIASALETISAYEELDGKVCEEEEIYEKEEEMIARHGILEEILVIDREQPGVLSATAAEIEMSPQRVMHQEVEDSLMDIVWPELVDAMLPFFLDVIAVADEAGLPLDVSTIGLPNSGSSSNDDNDNDDNDADAWIHDEVDREDGGAGDDRDSGGIGGGGDRVGWGFMLHERDDE